MDFTDRRRKPLDQITALLDEASGAVIRGVGQAMREASDINEIRDCAHRLSGFARRRREHLALDVIAEILLSRPASYHVGDSAAWALGDIGVWMDTPEFVDNVKQIVPEVVAGGDPRLIGHMAWICGEMAAHAVDLGLRQWAEEFIRRNAEPSVDLSQVENGRDALRRQGGDGVIILNRLSTQALASQIFGLYVGFALFAPILGGAIGDRWLGRTRAVALGAILMTVGHVCMAFDQSFLAAMLLLIVTTIVTAMGLARERESGTLEQVLVTPVRPSILILGIGCFLYDVIYIGLLYQKFRELKLHPFTRRPF